MKLMKKHNTHGEHYTPIQMKFPVDLEKIIEISDPIYTFNEIMEQIDLQKYFVEEGNKMGRPKFDFVKLLKIILFAFMENGYPSVRNINKLCNTDIRFIWLLDGTPAPSHTKISIKLFISSICLAMFWSIADTLTYPYSIKLTSRICRFYPHNIITLDMYYYCICKMCFLLRKSKLLKFYSLFLLLFNGTKQLHFPSCKQDI